VQGDAGHPGKQGGGQEKNNWKRGLKRRRRRRRRKRRKGTRWQFKKKIIQKFI
jgi:hypothetical protein